MKISACWRRIRPVSPGQARHRHSSSLITALAGPSGHFFSNYGLPVWTDQRDAGGDHQHQIRRATRYSSSSCATVPVKGSTTSDFEACWPCAVQWALNRTHLTPFLWTELNLYWHARRIKSKVGEFEGSLNTAFLIPSLTDFSVTSRWKYLLSLE